MDTEELRARLVEAEERIDRVGKRLTAGYGSDTDREGWLLWLRQLETRRAELRAQLGEEPGEPAVGADDTDAPEV